MGRLNKETVRRLSDEELQLEVARRRRARQRTRRGDEAGDRYAREILQFYANLELPVGASVDAIETAYARLRLKYEPAQHSSDPDKRQAAVALLASLKRAYEGLLAHKARGRAS